VGPSGSGKTTLLNIIGALDKPTTGWVDVAGHRVTDMDKGSAADFRLDHVGFIFQAYNLIHHLTVLENIEVPMDYAGVPPRASRERAEALAARVGLGDRCDHRPTQLSGGQQQRVAVARALANDPSLLLADEPTGNLDARTGRQVLDLLAELFTDQGSGLLIVTHSREVARRADRVLTLVEGRLEERVEGLAW